MALPVYLSNIKSSGVYTFEFDKSSIITATTSTIRLVVGFSKVGPFNTPVFCQDTRFFNEVFGNRDKQLEKKGSFFHLSALEMLNDAPIIALNLLKLDENDKTDFVSFSTSSSEKNQPVGSAPLSNYFDTSKFWKLDTDKALQNIDNQEGFSASLLNFANIGKNRVSIIVTKGSIQGLDITAKDWYGEADVPDFMDGSDLINDYVLRVNLIKGDLSDFETLSVDPVLGDYFDTNGIKKTFTDSNGNESDGLVALLNNPNIVSLGEYIGTLIPNFQDSEGNDIYIQDLINLDTPFTGVYCTVDEDLFDGESVLSGSVIDLLGGTLDSSNTNKIDFLSYLGTTLEDLAYPTTSGFDNQKSFNSAPLADKNSSTDSITSLTDTNAYTVDTDKYDTLTIYSPVSTDTNKPDSDIFSTDDEFKEFARSIKIDESFIKCTQVNIGATAGSSPTDIYALVKDVQLGTDRVIVQIYSVNEQGTKELFFSADSVNFASDNIELDVLPKQEFTDIVSDDIEVSKSSDLGQDIKQGLVSSADKIFDGTDNIDFNLSTILKDTISTNEFSHKVSFYKIVATSSLSSVTSPIQIKSSTGSIVRSFDTEKLNDYEFELDLTVYNLGDIQPGDFILRGFTQGVTNTKIDARTGNTRFTRVVSVKETAGDKAKIRTADPIFFEDNGNDTITRYKSVDNFASHYNIFALKGFMITQDKMPDGTAQRQKEILGVLTDTGLYDALVDKKAISFRYIVDTFEGTVEPNTKRILSSLCKDRQYAFAILNSPSVKTLDNSTNPLFKFDARSDYDPRYVSTGGNQNFNPSNVFTLPTQNQGSSYCAFYHPNLILREGNTTKSVPPAAYVSNNFVQKFRVGNPFDIIAGPRRGVVSGNNIVGVEYIYDRKGLDFVEPFGLNVIVPSNGIGNVINANQTAQQNIKSALSSVHVRELLIYIQSTVEQMLSNYRWEFNTPQTRLEIKTLVDAFLGRILNDNGLNDFETVMNTINNTPQVIDNDMGIIDIAVEPTRGLGKLVQRYTILKTGGISAGDFVVS